MLLLNLLNCHGKMEMLSEKLMELSDETQKTHHAARKVDHEDCEISKGNTGATYVSSRGCTDYIPAKTWYIVCQHCTILWEVGLKGHQLINSVEDI